jgi:hypothetical protein
MTDLPRLREAVAKGVKLLEALAEPHEQPDGEDHAWRSCRRCLALEEGETEHARQLFRALLDELEALRAACRGERDRSEAIQADLAAARAVLETAFKDGFEVGCDTLGGSVSTSDEIDAKWLAWQEQQR